MTEAEWLAATDPTPMLKLMEGEASNRKVRLFMVSLARMFWDQVPEGDLRDAVNESERFADNLTQFDKIDEHANRYHHYLLGTTTAGPSEPYDWYQTHAKARAAYSFVALTMKDDWALQFVLELPQPLRHLPIMRDDSDPFLHHLLLLLPPYVREIFGNPFRPVNLDRSWLTSTVHALANGIYSEKAFDRMPILADALQDAGCDNEDILNHCRQPGEHVRGCWALDLLLGKS